MTDCVGVPLLYKSLHRSLHPPAALPSLADRRICGHDLITAPLALKLAYEAVPFAFS